MENIKVNVPEGYEIDKERSNIDLERGIIDIKLKEKIERWRDNIDAIVKGYYINGGDSEIIKVNDTNTNCEDNYNIFATEKQAKSALAMARISQIMANDERFGGVITDEEWEDNSKFKFVINRLNNNIYIVIVFMLPIIF